VAECCDQLADACLAEARVHERSKTSVTDQSEDMGNTFLEVGGGAPTRARQVAVLIFDP
jgi:hypothetical protein